MTSTSTRMPFGKHLGKLLSDVPLSYLAWCLRECENLEPYLRHDIEQEIRRQTGRTYREHRDRQHQQGRSSAPPPPADWSAVIRQWHRELVMRHHPDRGGSVEVMAALNSAVDRLKQLVGVE